ncbi:hypothetical protein AAG570_012469 [Ranatra chinensis]|uniref:Uncharacterized protein n=1 Tax=Ranatra chinensis TaxID=642074 RepID=A0ABD0Z275_9HEMI
MVFVPRLHHPLSLVRSAEDADVIGECCGTFLHGTSDNPGSNKPPTLYTLPLKLRTADQCNTRRRFWDRLQIRTHLLNRLNPGGSHFSPSRDPKSERLKLPGSHATLSWTSNVGEGESVTFTILDR